MLTGDVTRGRGFALNSKTHTQNGFCPRGARRGTTAQSSAAAVASMPHSLCEAATTRVEFARIREFSGCAKPLGGSPLTVE